MITCSQLAPKADSLSRRSSLRKLLILGLVCASMARAQGGDTPALQSARIRLRTLSFEIAKSHTLSLHDKRFVMEQLDSAYALNRSFAMLVLEGAVDAKAYPRSDYLSILEKKAKQAIGPAAGTYLQAYAAALKMGAPDNTFKKGVRAIGLKRKDPQALDSEERALIAASFRSSENGNWVAGALVMFVKSQMDKGSLQWSKTQLSNRTSGSKGDAKLFWQFVTRTVLAHNPARPK